MSEATSVRLTMLNIRNLKHVQKWAAIAESIGISEGATVEVSGVNSALSVTQAQVSVPDPRYEAEGEGT